MSSAPSPFSYVHDGRECFGFILTRGKLGFEEIDRNDRDLVACAMVEIDPESFQPEIDRLIGCARALRDLDMPRTHQA